MPANLPPTYHEAEDRYRAASTPEEKIAALEEMLRIMPKHKGTDKLQADVKSRIAKLKRQLREQEKKIAFLEAQEQKRLGQPQAAHTIELVQRQLLQGVGGVGFAALALRIDGAHREHETGAERVGRAHDRAHIHRLRDALDADTEIAAGVCHGGRQTCTGSGHEAR